MSECGECTRLQTAVTNALERIEVLTKKKLGAVANKEILMDADKQLELTMGEKERAIGALLEHQRTH
jgi:hypothetical protein